MGVHSPHRGFLDGVRLPGAADADGAAGQQSLDTLGSQNLRNFRGGGDAHFHGTCDALDPRSTTRGVLYESVEGEGLEEIN